MNAHHSYWESNVKKAVDAGKRLGVQPVLTPKDMTNPDVEHLGIMSYVANLQWVTPRPPLSDSIVVHLESTSGRVGEPVKGFSFARMIRLKKQSIHSCISFNFSLQTYFRVEILNHEIDLSSVRAYVNPPTGIQQSVKLNPNGQGMFLPDKYGMHEIQIEVNEDKLVIDIPRIPSCLPY